MKHDHSTAAPSRAILCLCCFMTLVDFAAPASLDVVKARVSKKAPPPPPKRALAFGPHESAVVVVPEVQPKALDCKTALDCTRMKKVLTTKFCRWNPEYPGCKEMYQCPPGGCGHGQCKVGYCNCDSGWQGKNCMQQVLFFPADFDIDAYNAAKRAGTIPGFGAPSPGPLSLRAPSPGPMAIYAYGPAAARWGPGAPGYAPGPAPYPMGAPMFSPAWAPSFGPAPMFAPAWAPGPAVWEGSPRPVPAPAPAFAPGPASPFPGPVPGPAPGPAPSALLAVGKHLRSAKP